MDPTVTHDEVRELLGVFALDAVDPGEAAAIRAHLGDCPRCRDEVADYQQTAALLANTGGAAPAEVWDAIVVQIEQPATAVGEFPGLPRRGRRPPAPGRRIRPGVVRRAAVLTAAAAIAVIAVLGVEVGHLNHRLNQVAAASDGHNMSAQALSALLDPAARRMTLVRRGNGRGAGCDGRRWPLGRRVPVQRTTPGAAGRRDLPVVGNDRRPTHLRGSTRQPP